MEITLDELAEKLSGVVPDPQAAAAHVFEELTADRMREAAAVRAGG